MEHRDPVSQYKDLPVWEDVVMKISTVERGPNNRLIVYMIMLVLVPFCFFVGCADGLITGRTDQRPHRIPRLQTLDARKR